MNDQSPPKYYLPGEVRALRDADRRHYRFCVIWLVIYQLMVVGPVRLAIDLMLINPRFGDMTFIRPYIVPGMVGLVILIWVFGLQAAFRRRF